MSIIINSNLATSQSSLSLKRASERLSKSLQRISSGNRIVTPSEDAGGLAVAMKLESSLRRATATMNNTQNGISFLQMQDGALKVAGEIVDRMAELKSFYNDVSKNADDRENYNHEFRELQKELASLKAQKFNGVSLFATDPSTAGINIMTSDDGLGDPIELSRTGLFENFKSKFGADGKLNTGSSGEFRQLVGEFAVDGGTYDANPGYSTKDYKEGEVVYRVASTDSESGYFMALRDVAAGSRITDTMDLTSNWIRVADKNGSGFSEAYPDAGAYDMSNLQFNSNGEAMAYLKGDIIMVQAHWNDPNSFIFLKAENDVPQNILIDELLLSGIGSGKYFDFIGQDQTGDEKGRPTTQFTIPNKEHETPLSVESENSQSLREALLKSGGNNYTPTFVEDANGDIFKPLISDWNLKFWSEGSANFEPGDLIFDNNAAVNGSFLFQVSNSVKGRFSAGDYSEDDIVFANGKWYKANEEASGYNEVFGDTIYTKGESQVRGNLPSDMTLFPNDAYRSTDNNWYQFLEPEGLSVEEGFSNDDILNEGFNKNAIFYVKDGDGKITFYKVTDEDTGDFEKASIDDLTEDTHFKIVNQWVSPESVDEDNPFWKGGNWDEISPLSANSGFANDVTDEYAKLSNKDIWSKTYYGALNGVTVKTDYERGDNIFYQGKHYVYVSHLPSSDEAFSGEDGLNDFQQLLLNGAVKELGVHVETTGAGGSSDKDPNSFFRANQNLDYVDRLPGSGLVRTSGAARQGDPAQNGDGIFNSLDDQLFSELNPGNDGIYGTMDDFYSATPYQSVATSAGHIDSDADNNKDLLDLSNDLGDFSVADFVDYTQTVANFRAVNGGTMSRINYTNRILEENKVNLESARGRIMDTDIALEASKMARQNVIMQASAAMVTQSNQMQQIVLQLLQ